MKHKFNLFITKKQQYAYYIIKRLRCNLNMTGSTPAEQNHSSVKRHLGKEYYESVDCMIRDFLHRHNFHALQRTRKLTEQKQRLLFLNNGICNITNPQHKLASSNVICLEAFNMWEKEHVHATKLLTSKDINGDVKVSLNGRERPFIDQLESSIQPYLNVDSSQYLPQIAVSMALHHILPHPLLHAGDQDLLPLA